MGARENWKGECQEYQSHGKIMERDKTEYSSHAIAEVVDGDWILVTRSRIGK